MLGIPSNEPVGSDSESLRQFYTSIFPSEKICQWLTYGSPPRSNALSKREFSFTLQGGIYTRFLSFNSCEDFTQKLKHQLPVKIDIGAVYNMRPSERKGIGSSQFRPLEKELVFDIDMTDYDDARTCCKLALMPNLL